eukprot:3957652-Alexandrium_andersonii.AAC.1
MDITRWMTCDFARSLDLTVADWNDNAATTAKAEELYKNDNHPIFYVHVKHHARKQLQTDIRAGMEAGGLAGG